MRLKLLPIRQRSERSAASGDRAARREAGRAPRGLGPHWEQELGKEAPSLRRLARLWRAGLGEGSSPWGVAGLMAAAKGCKSEAALRWLDRRGARWEARGADGLGFEHWAALKENACALKFWKEKGLSIRRRDALGLTAFERAMGSPSWGAELMLRVWPKELGEAEARSALYKAGARVGKEFSATHFARAVGMVCRERPGAIAPDRRLSTLWERLFPGPLQTPRRMLQALEDQSKARFEAREIRLAMAPSSKEGWGRAEGDGRDQARRL